MLLHLNIILLTLEIKHIAFCVPGIHPDSLTDKNTDWQNCFLGTAPKLDCRSMFQLSTFSSCQFCDIYLGSIKFGSQQCKSSHLNAVPGEVCFVILFKTKTKISLLFDFSQDFLQSYLKSNFFPNHWSLWLSRAAIFKLGHSVRGIDAFGIIR